MIYNKIMIGYVYQLTERRTNKSYIGATTKTVDQRINGHFASARSTVKQLAPIHKAICATPSRDTWTWKCLETVSCSTRKELESQEGFWIAKLGTLIPSGFNVAEKGCKRSGARNSFYGHHHTKQTRVLIASKQDNIGTKNPFFGRHHTKETCEHIRQIRTGSKDTKATRRKKSMWQKGRKLPAAHKENISKGWQARTEPTKAKGVPKSQAHNNKVADARRGSKLVDGHYVHPTK